MKKIVSFLLVIVSVLCMAGSAAARPSFRPSIRPSIRPAVRPSVRPSVKPSVKPSVEPSVKPSVRPAAPSDSGGIFPNWWWFWGSRNNTIYYCKKCDCKNLSTGWFSNDCKNCGHAKGDHVRR